MIYHYFHATLAQSPCPLNIAWQYNITILTSPEIRKIIVVLRQGQQAVQASPVNKPNFLQSFPV